MGVNWGYYSNPKVDALIDEAQRTFDVQKQDELIGQARALIVDDAALVFGSSTTPIRTLCRRRLKAWFNDGLVPRSLDHWDRLITW